MKILATDNLTGITKEVEVDETLIPQSEPTPIEPTIEEKIEQMQTTLSTVVDTLAEIVGVE
jgi:hypothetical protein